MGTWIENPRIDQQMENSIEVEINVQAVLMALEEGMNAQLVVKLLKNGVARFLRPTSDWSISAAGSKSRGYNHITI